MEKRRTILSLLLGAIGLCLLVLGLFHESAAISSGGQDQEQIATMSEAAITREVARGGLERSESGEIRKTYEEGQQAPDACPT